jgi:hypothetical protein
MRHRHANLLSQQRLIQRYSIQLQQDQRRKAIAATNGAVAGPAAGQMQGAPSPSPAQGMQHQQQMMMQGRGQPPMQRCVMFPFPT